MAQVAWWIALALALIATLVSAVTLIAILRLRLVAVRGRTTAPQDVPADVRALLAPAEQLLARLGFVESGSFEIEAMAVQGKPHPQAVMVFLHRDAPVAAFVTRLLLPDRSRHFSIQFASRHDDGTVLVTRNRLGIAGPSPRPTVVVRDGWLPTWDEVWQAHAAHMRGLDASGSGWRTLDGAQWIAESIHAERETFDLHVARGDYVDAGDGTWRLGARRALVTLGRAWAAWWPSRHPMRDDVAVPGAPGADAAAAVLGLASTAVPPTVHARVDAYERDAAQRRTPWSSRAKWLVFAVTAALAAASFGLSLDAATLAALMLVLLFHEMGHFLAMRRVGYRDLSVFFMPFLGAAVTGQHDRVTPRQELFVLFAGPLPGLVLGLAVLVGFGAQAIDSTPWLHHLAILAVLINAFNLLPIHPLDGGKIFEILLLSRWPWAAFAARVAGIGALAWYALAAGAEARQPVLLALAALMVLGVSHQWREARVATSLQRDAHRHAAVAGAAPHDRRGALEAVFARVEQLGYADRPWHEQRLLADSLVPKLVRPPMKAGARLLGLGGYVVALLLPLIVLFAQGWRAAGDGDLDGDEGAAIATAQRERAAESWREERRRQLEALRAGLARENDSARRWQLFERGIGVLLVAVDEQTTTSDTAVAQAAATPANPLEPDLARLLDEAAALASILPDPIAKSATVALWRHTATRDPAARLGHLEDAWRAYEAAPQAQDTDPGPLLRAALSWLDEAPRSVTLGERMARVDRCLERAGAREEHFGAQALHSWKTEFLMASGRVADALSYARGRYDAALASGDAASVVAGSRRLVEATWAAHGAPAALTVLDEMLPRLESLGATSTFLVRHLQRQGMWIAEAAGRTDWQRAHAGALAAMRSDAMTEVPWWTSVMLWVMTGGASLRAPLTVVQLEEAHWRGDADEARRIATQLRERPRGVPLLPPGADGPDDERRVIASRVRRAMDDARRAMYAHYGLTLAAGREAPVR